MYILEQVLLIKERLKSNFSPDSIYIMNIKVQAFNYTEVKTFGIGFKKPRQ